MNYNDSIMYEKRRNDDMKNKTPAVGEKAPDFKVLTSKNKSFKLSSVLKSGRKMLLVFYRGHW